VSVDGRGMTGDELTPVGDAPAGATAAGTRARHTPTTRDDSHIVVRRLLTRFLLTAPGAAAAHKVARPSCGAGLPPGPESFKKSFTMVHLTAIHTSRAVHTSSVLFLM